MIPASYLFRDAYDRAWRDRGPARSGPGRRLIALLRRLVDRRWGRGAEPRRRRLPAE